MTPSFGIGMSNMENNQRLITSATVFRNAALMDFPTIAETRFVLDAMKLMAEGIELLSNVLDMTINRSIRHHALHRTITQTVIVDAFRACFDNRSKNSEFS